MRKLKKATALLLCLLMTFSLAACGGGTTKETGGTGEKAENGEAQADSGSTGILTETGTYPIVKEPIELTLFCVSMPNVEDFATNDFTKFMEEKTGIKINFETGSRDDWETKLNLAFSTGDYPDMIMFASPSQAKYGVKEGILLQLDDLIEANMPNYMANMGEYIDATRQTDGHIYAICGLNECYHCMYAKKMWVNTYWLDKMGIDVPTTTDEFYDACKKFLEINPTGIAVGGAKDGWHARFEEWMTNAFILSPSKSQDYRVEVGLAPEGKIRTIANTDEYKEALKYMNSLYKLGAIYDGDFTQTEEQLRALANQEGEPVLFLPCGTISNHFDADNNNETYRHYQVMAPIAGPDGTRRATYMKYAGLGEGDFFVTDKCKYPEAALRWIDYFFTTEGALSSQYGAEEGTDWVLNPEGKRGLNGEPAMYEVLNPYSGEAQNHDWQDVQVKYFPAEFRLGESTDQNVDVGTSLGLEKLLYDATKEKMEPYAQKEGDWDVLPYLKLTDEEATKIQTIGVEVENYIEENKVAFITGRKDFDKDWDSYVKGFDNVGLPTLLEVYQTAYDRQSSK